MHKRIFISLSLCMAVFSLMAQAPQSMDFQSIIRDSKGNLVTNQSIGLRISVLRDSVTGAAVYTETHNAITNNGGLVTITIGRGTTSNDFSTIEWGKGPYFVKTEVDVTGGTNYSLSSTNQMMSVPYALYANSAGNYQAKLDSLERKIASMEPYIPTTHMDGFTVAPGRQVHFAKGYLRKSSSGVYSISDNQYNLPLSDEYFFKALSANLGSSLIKDITSTAGDYGVYYRANLPSGNWRTLTGEEWGFIIYGRKNSKNLATLATINGRKGLLLLPDTWKSPEDVSIIIDMNNSQNTFSIKQWSSLEAAGAVFIAYGTRELYGSPSFTAYYLTILSGSGEIITNKRISGRIVESSFYDVSGACVRLVEDYQ